MIDLVIFQCNSITFVFMIRTLMLIRINKWHICNLKIGTLNTKAHLVPLLTFLISHFWKSIASDVSAVGLQSNVM